MWAILGIGVASGLVLALPSRSDLARGYGSYGVIPSQATVRIFRRHPHHAPSVVIHHNVHHKHKHRPHAYDAYGNYRRG